MATHLCIGPAKKPREDALVDLVAMHKLEQNGIRGGKGLEGIYESRAQGLENLFFLHVVHDPLLTALQGILETGCDGTIIFLSAHKIIISVSGDRTHPSGKGAAALILPDKRRALEGSDQAIAQHFDREHLGLDRRGPEGLQMAFEEWQKLGKNP